MTKRKTAGELSLKATSDTTKYDPLEVGYALTDDIYKEMMICAERHKLIFDEPEYFVCMVVAGDPLIQGIRRHKYHALLHLPSPRPEQIVCLYNKITDKLIRLWSLPNATLMALLSEAKFVAPRWKKTKGWVDAFYKLDFWNYIRKESGINHLSEYEYLRANREKFIQAGCQESTTKVTEPFDFSKVKIDHIVDTKTARTN